MRMTCRHSTFLITIVFMILMYSHVLLKAHLIYITYDEAYTIREILFSPQVFDLANNYVL